MNTLLEEHRRWMVDVARLVVQGRRQGALRRLDSIMKDLPLFSRGDASLLQERRLGWLYRIGLLECWGRHMEALAWTCLECELFPDNVPALAKKEQLKRFLNVSGADPSDSAREPPTRVPWEGVAGMREIRALLERDVILPLRNPALYRKYKLDLPNGLLLFGPPGCGKTFLARKLAQHVDYSFIEVKPSDLGSIYVHGGQDKIAELFRRARDEAPTLLFFDELDAVTPRRDGDTSHHYRAEVNEFLVHMNECRAGRVLVIGATNRPEHLDPAVVRAGRLDKKIFVGPPDFEARAELLKLSMRGRPQARIDWVAAASATELLTCAELVFLVEEAARVALSRNRKIETRDLLTARREGRFQLTAEGVERMRRIGFL